VAEPIKEVRHRPDWRDLQLISDGRKAQQTERKVPTL
jgi:hypothetical protein